METEKITINLGVVELGKIDVLVENGIFTNRTDFIRTAIRNNLVQYDSDIKDYVKPPFESTRKTGINWRWNMGINNLTYDYLHELQTKGERARITTVGMLVINNNIPPELFRNTVEKVKVYGKLVASDEIKQIISETEERGNG